MMRDNRKSWKSALLVKPKHFKGKLYSIELEDPRNENGESNYPPIIIRDCEYESDVFTNIDDRDLKFSRFEILNWMQQNENS